MDKKQKKELGIKLSDSISDLLSEIDTNAASGIKKAIKKESEYLIRKFSRAVKKNKKATEKQLPETEK